MSVWPQWVFIISVRVLPRRWPDPRINLTSGTAQLTTAKATAEKVRSTYMMSGSLTFCTSAMHALYKDQLIVTSGQLPTVHIAASRYRRQTGKIDVMEGIGSTENGQRQRSLF